MKIESVEKVISFIVDTDAKEFPTFRRGENSGWERLMGESWEACYTDEQALERMYQKYLAMPAGTLRDDVGVHHEHILLRGL